MVATPIKAVLFLAGGCAAAGAVAYASGALDPLFTNRPTTIAALPEQTGLPEQPGESPALKDARLPDTELPAATPSQKPAATPLDKPAEAVAPTAPAEPAVLPPSFDVVRVEGGGSIVIAGKATPSANVELLVGSRVIGEAATGADGDFAVVLEEPLKPGNYQIVLRSTAPDGVVAMSIETAVVSIPETKDGQVLALVEEPGKPSEMITVPKPEAPSKGAQAPVTPPAAAAPAAESKPGEQVEAALPPKPAPVEPPAAPAAAGPHVVVEAVEIDGRKIFVAGGADAGRTVRGYANDILLGDATASPDGRYLIEAERDLPVGDYIIRIDALEPDGVKVAARAAVPFEREPGETIAAVAPLASGVPAPPAQAPATETPPAAGVAPATPPATAPDAVAEAPTAPAASGTEPGKAPAAEAPATAEAPAIATPPVIAEAPLAPGTQAAKGEAPTLETSPAVSASKTPAAETPAAGTPASESPPATAETPSGVAEAPAAEAPAEMAIAPATEAPATGTDVTAAPPPAGVPESVSPKLQNVGSAVIIRRGDTLWRISHRVYGRGVRYSTIYLANQAQIEDPDRIWPGQVFKVPEKSADGEADADYSTLGDRLTTVPEDGEPEKAPAEAQQ